MIETEEIYAFKKQLKQLGEIRGRGTELVSVYIPAKYPIPEILNKIRTEISQAENIKSKTTRNGVINALERILAHLKLFKCTPPNGMAVFAGDISDNPSKTNFQLFYLEPPQPLNISVYKCDSSFFLEPLRKMIETTDVYGLVVMDGREATIALLKGTQTVIVKELRSTAHAKIRKGGQSARRFERLIEESIEYYYKRIGEAMDSAFLNKVKGVIIGGPGPAKEYFHKMAPYNYQHKILGVVDTGYTDEYGIREVLVKSESLIKEQETNKERKIIENFISTISRSGPAVYGEKEIRNAIETNKAETILLSEGLEYIRMVVKCTSCNNEETKIIGKNESIPLCIKCNAKTKVESEKLLIDDLTELAKEQGIKVEIISKETIEGTQFLQGFGGIGAFLRY